MSADPLSALIAAAARRAGTEDFGTDEFRPALLHPVVSIANESGVSIKVMPLIRERLVQALTRRARLVEFVRRHPEVREVPLADPIFVTGLPRSGTTMLHNLLARHPGLRAPLLWEMFALIPPDEKRVTEARWREFHIQRAERLVQDMQRAELTKIHPVSPHWPDECSWLFRNGFATLIEALRFRIPTYARWLLEADMEPHYRFYRLQLQVLQWRHRHSPGTRLVLKDPSHLWNLTALRKVFPQARILLLHRRLEETLPSLASLCTHLRRAVGCTVDLGSVGPYCLDLVEPALTSLPAARRTIGDDAVLDVAYTDLVAAPRQTLGAILAWLGCARDDAALDASLTWLAEHPQHRAGRHEYTLEQYGLDSASLRQRFGDQMFTRG
jgi:hypothetical protein